MTSTGIAACSRDLRAPGRGGDLPPDVLAEIAAAHASLCGDSGVARGRGALVGDHRGRERRELRRSSGHLPMGHEYVRCAAAGAQLLGEPLFGGIDQLPPQKAASRSRASRWRSSCRAWWMRGPPACMFTRSPVYGRPLGHHDRRCVGARLRGGRWRGDAGPLGDRQDHRRDLGARDIGQDHPASSRPRWRHRQPSPSPASCVEPPA